MAINERKRARLTGKGRTGTFLALPGQMTESEAWGQLSGNATKLIIELARQFNGKNNGDLSVPWSKLKRRGWRSKSTLWEATREAVAAGFIKVTRVGGRHRVCALYAITWKPVDACGTKHAEPAETVPSNLWKKTENEFAMCTSQPPIGTHSEPKVRKAA